MTMKIDRVTQVPNIAACSALYLLLFGVVTWVLFDGRDHSAFENRVLLASTACAVLVATGALLLYATPRRRSTTGQSPERRP